MDEVETMALDLVKGTLNKVSLAVVHPDIKSSANSISFGSKEKKLEKIHSFKTPNNALINSLNSNNAAVCTVRFDMQMKKNFCPVMNAILGKILHKGSNLMSEEDF